MKRLKFRLVLTLLLAVLPIVSYGTGDEIKFGVFPYLPPSKLNNLFTPIAAEFEQVLGRHVTLGTRMNYASFTEEIKSEKYDIAFVQPFDYVMAHDQYNYLPLARRGNSLRAILVVEQDSPIKSMADLPGKTIANPPKVAAVSHLTSMALGKAGIDPVDGVRRYYVKSHFSCMQRVLIGTADACGTARQAMLHFEKKNMTGRLRIVAESEAIPHSLFIVHKRVPAELRKKLEARILDWPNTPEGKELLANGKFIPFVRARNQDYDIIREYIRGSNTSE